MINKDAVPEQGGLLSMGATAEEAGREIADGIAGGIKPEGVEGMRAAIAEMAAVTQGVADVARALSDVWAEFMPPFIALIREVVLTLWRWELVEYLVEHHVPRRVAQFVAHHLPGRFVMWLAGRLIALDEDEEEDEPAGKCEQTYTERDYDADIDDLTAWFSSRLSGHGPIRLSRRARSARVDGLPADLKALVYEAARIWERERGYELSYNQVCIAFFEAAGSLIVVDEDEEEDEPAGKYEQVYAERDYSADYGRQIDDLITWFGSRLGDHEPIRLSRHAYSMGVDALPADLKELVREASSVWEQERGYELSYNQVCIAFFEAAGSLIVVEEGDGNGGDQGGSRA